MAFLKNMFLRRPCGLRIHAIGNSPPVPRTMPSSFLSSRLFHPVSVSTNSSRTSIRSTHLLNRNKNLNHGIHPRSTKCLKNVVTQSRSLTTGQITKQQEQQPRRPIRRLIFELFFWFTVITGGAKYISDIIFSMKFGPLLSPDMQYEKRVLSYTEAVQARTRYDPIDKPLYEGLKDGQFRFLILEPGVGSKIQCRLVVQDVVGRSPPPYEALSYVWGSEENKVTIDCNGYQKEVTRNLYDALVELRLPYAPRVLWCDALCINQEDEKERSAQVQNMGGLYSSAYRVMIFLGKETEDTEGAFALLKYMHSSLNYNSRRSYELSSKFFPDDYVSADSLGEKGISQEAEEGCWSRIEALLCRPWFHRLWILQEVVNANKATIFTSATNSLDWDNFFTAIHNLRQIPQMRGKLSDEAEKASRMIVEIHEVRQRNIRRHWLRKSKQERRFFHMLLLASSSNCSDAKDRIYAVLGLANDLSFSDRRGPLKPNYDPATTTEDVYRKFAEWSIMDKKNLHILSCASKSASESGLPSWVPDWRDIPNRDVFTRYDDHMPFSAGIPGLFGSRLDSDPQIQGDRLSLCAREVGSVQQVGNPPKRAIHATDGQHIAGLLLQFQLLHHLSGTPEGEFTAEHSREFLEYFLSRSFQADEKRLWKPMVCGLTSDGHPASALYFLHFINFYLFVHATEIAPNHEEKNDFIKNRNEGRGYFWQSISFYLSSLEKWSSPRLPGYTAERQMCWLPPGTREKDAIYVIPGCQVPYVFRPRRDGTFMLVGEAYVHGIMQGQARPKKKSDLERIVIV